MLGVRTSVLLAGLLATIVGAQNRSAKDQLAEARQKFYAGSAQEAIEQVSQVSSAFPRLPDGPISAAVFALWRALGAQTTNDFRNSTGDVRKYSAQAIDRAGGLLRGTVTPEGLFFRGTAKGLAALADALDSVDMPPIQRFSTRFAAMSRLSEMESDLRECLRMNPRFIDAEFGLGLVDLFRDGNETDGLKRLWSVSENGEYFRVEAAYAIADFAFGQKAADKIRGYGIPALWQLTEQYPMNRDFRTALGKSYYEVANNTEAAKVFADLVAGAIGVPIPVEPMYFLGTIALDAGDSTKAQKYFRDVVSTRPERPAYLIPWTLLRLAECDILSGNVAEAKRSLQRVFDGPDVNGVKSLARALAVRAR